MGFIDIEFDPSDSEDESGFFERKEFGKVYKLPEKGIKLDFISRQVTCSCIFRISSDL
jgi:hypothetical protein